MVEIPEMLYNYAIILHNSHLFRFTKVLPVPEMTIMKADSAEISFSNNSSPYAHNRNNKQTVDDAPDMKCEEPD